MPKPPPTSYEWTRNFRVDEIRIDRLGLREVIGQGDSAAVLRSRCVEQSWIESQHRYFTAKVNRLERSSRRVRMLRDAVFVVILVVIVALFLFGEPMHHYQMGLGVTLHNLLTFCMGFLAVLLGVWELHQDKMATRELLWQYRNQLNHFSRARAQLSRITEQSRRNAVLEELGYLEGWTLTPAMPESTDRTTIAAMLAIQVNMSQRQP